MMLCNVVSYITVQYSENSTVVHNPWIDAIISPHVFIYLVICRNLRRGRLQVVQVL